MKYAKRMILSFSLLLLVSVFITACNSKTVEKDNEISTQNESEKSKTRKYKDYMGHEVDIPASPKRVIFHGENFGDLLAIGVDAVGTGNVWIKDHIYEDRAKDVEDVGFPVNLEKVLELKPDLFVFAGSDEKVYEQLSKIAPTIVFDSFAPLEDRLSELGDILGKKQEADNWLKEYNKKLSHMWQQLIEDGTIQPGETATVLTYYPGNRLFIMGTTGLSQVLYSPQGFKPGDKIQKFLDEKKGFAEISLELLPEYAGDRIFVLNPETNLHDAKESTAKMINSQLWNDLPAVKNGHVYFIDIQKSNSDASTREWLLEEVPRMLKK
ncbi:Iron(3+)-hydroxamate-binding protein YxeB [Gottschalkia acidurici 9a]|uniref:Iron(3+)-hydroxamate-binding protein YxeB n=1 Tax=Gottschalkia acidurici (strain ATCC 7906 / DSM 604 / BCRC 14475 / CIP 104303 / KCTC 5404 / NCIMB 10678 / 9a) TaxID=1128398 RepID=K0AYJ4_GOTA9|nr:ABC transporter substrate-binding protein [Gottschalkia acidurici]AFS77466.1 Iron(3+)-hydroxamate-binding protein YxeB [Gottschalkia acidurici 9a]